jgi:hypothetical protein
MAVFIREYLDRTSSREHTEQRLVATAASVHEPVVSPADVSGRHAQREWSNRCAFLNLKESSSALPSSLK